MISTQTTTYQTREVLAGAYVKDNGEYLSHTIVVETGSPLCKRVKPASIADASAGDVNERPSCPVCAKRDPRFAGVAV